MTQIIIGYVKEVQTNTNNEMEQERVTGKRYLTIRGFYPYPWLFPNIKQITVRIYKTYDDQ